MADALTKLKEQQDALLKSINEARLEIETLTEEKKKAEANLVSIQILTEQQEDVVALQNSKIKAGNDELVKISRQIQTTGTKDDELEKNIASMKNELEVLTKEVEETRKNILVEIGEHAEKLDAMIADKQGKVKELDKIELVLLENNKVISEGNTQLLERQELHKIEIENLKKDIDKILEDKVKAINETTSAQKTFDELKAKIEAAKKDYDDENKKLGTLREESAKVQTELSDLESKKEEIRQKQIALAERDVQLIAKDDELRQAFDNWGISYDGTTYPKPIKYSQAEFVALKADLKQKENEIRAKFKELNIPYESS